MAYLQDLTDLKQRLRTLEARSDESCTSLARSVTDRVAFELETGGGLSAGFWDKVSNKVRQASAESKHRLAELEQQQQAAQELMQVCNDRK